MKRLVLLLSVFVLLASSSFAVSDAELNQNIQVELVKTDPSVVG